MDAGDEKRLRAERNVARAAARIAASRDGQVVMAYLERVIGWDEAGPPGPEMHAIHFWTGQRSVVKLLRDQVVKGGRVVE